MVRGYFHVNTNIGKWSVHVESVYKPLTFLSLCLGMPTVTYLYIIYYILICILKDQLQPVATGLYAVYKYF